jgi:hypothetical protein
MDHYGINFSFPDSVLLPLKLNPRQKMTVDICYTPHAEGFDSTVMHWGTNLQQPYLHSVKDTSIFMGRGVKAGFVWDRNQQVFLADSTIPNDSVIRRIFLYNSSTDLKFGPNVHVQNVLLSGADAAEFYILQDMLNKLPLGNFDLQPGDSIWVDVVFKPDMTKGFRDRHADLVASGSSAKDQIVNLIGTWAKSGVAASALPAPFTIYPNPVSGNSVIVSFSSAQEKNGTLILYDILGREVYHSEILSGSLQAEIPVRHLNAGAYYVRFSSNSGIFTQKLEIIRK